MVQPLEKQKLEQISRDVHEVFIIAKTNHQVTHEHVSILLTCIQELIKEVEKYKVLLVKIFVTNT